MYLKNLHTQVFCMCYRKITFKSYFGMKAFLHKDIHFYTLYTVCIYKSVSLSGLCPNVLWKQQKQSL